jgi:predicted N-acetyltransferase YhbS
MKDMLVRLYDVEEDAALEKKLNDEGVKIFRLLSPDISKATDFARTFGGGWADECLAACTNHPASCFVAVRNKEMIGFACYNATAKDYFGPTGVLKSERGKGIGMVLLKKCLCALTAEGYSYAIIGGVGDAQPFYEKSVDAVVIEKSSPGLYATLIKFS